MRCSSSTVMMASAAIARMPANFASDARSASSVRRCSSAIAALSAAGFMSLRADPSSGAGRRVRRTQDADLQREIHVLGAVRDPELLVHPLLVGVDRLGADEQLLPDLRGRVALGNEAQHVTLALRQ